MINTLKLKALFIENDLKNETVAKILGISKQSLSMKLNNKREFKVSEIYKLKSILNINFVDFETIFFAKNVDLKSTY